MSPNSNINEALPSELLVAVFERATGGAGLGQLRLVCRHWAGVAGTFYRRLFAQAVAAAGGVGATCGDRLWQTVKGEVRAYLRDVWTADRGLGDTGKWSREFLWANQPVDPGNASFEAQELYRGIIRAHFAGIAPGCSPEDLALLRSSFIRSIDAQPSSSTEAAAIHLLLYRLAYLRLRVLTKLSSKSMLYVDAQDRLRLVRRPTEPLPEPSPSDGALENVETSKEEPALPTLLPFLPKVDASADPIAVFSPHGTRIIFVCSKDVSPSSTLPFPDDKRPKRKKAPEWPNFGPEINQRCLVSCWTDGTDWREMDLTWEGSIHFSFTLTPPVGVPSTSTAEPYILLTRDSSFGYLIITAFPLSTFPEGGVDLPGRMEGMRELHGGVGLGLSKAPIPGKKPGFWVSGHEYFPALADARAPLDSLLSASARDRDRFAPQPGTPAFFRAMLREALMPGSIGSAMHIDPFANDQKVLVKGGEVVVLGWVDADGNYAEDEGSLAASSDSESEFDENDTASSTDSEDEAWLNDPTPAMDRGKDLKGKGLAHPPREKTTYYSHPYSTSLKQSNLFVSTRPDAAIVARLHKVDQPPVVAAAVDAAALNAIWAAGGTANQAQQQQGPAWSLDVIMVDLLHAQRDRQRRAELEQLVVDIRAQMHWEATHPRSADGKGKGKPGNVRTINEYRTPTEQREVDKPLWAPDEHIHGMKELWQREPEDDPDMMRDNGNETMLIAPTDPTLNPNRDGFVTLQAAETADEERGYLDLLQEAAGDLYEGKRAARVLLRIPLPGALLTWMRELRDGDMEDEATFHTEELGMPAPPPPRPGANEQPGTAGASNVATLANLQQQAPQPTPQQQRNNPAEMQHLLRNANFYLDPTGSGLAALTRRGGPDSARTVWIIDLGRNYEGRRGSVWDPFGLSDFVEGEEEDEFGREQNERLNTVQQLWGTSVATYVFEKPVRTFTWVGGGKFVAVTGERSCPPPGQAQPAESNVGGRTLNEDAGWERESARRQRFDRKDLLTSWHLIQVSRKEHPKPARSWELPGAAGPNGAAAAREIVPRTTLEVTEIGSSQRLHMPQLLMPDGVSQISEGGVARLDPANVSSDGEVFTNVLSAAQIRLIKVVLEPESLPQRPKRSLISNVSRGLWKLALSAADSYFGTTWVDDLDRDDDPERVKSMVRITRVVSPRGLGDSEAGCETIDIPGKYARFSPI